MNIDSGISSEVTCLCKKTKHWMSANKITKPCPNCGRIYVGKETIDSRGITRIVAIRINDIELISKKILDLTKESKESFIKKALKFLGKKYKCSLCRGRSRFKTCKRCSEAINKGAKQIEEEEDKRILGMMMETTQNGEGEKRNEN